MKTAIRWGACLVIAATSAATLANDGAGNASARHPEPEPKTEDRADDGTATAERGRTVHPQTRNVRTAMDERVAEAGTGSAAPRNADGEISSFEARWLVEREGYRDGGY
jgi:hypothetical protein